MALGNDRWISKIKMTLLFCDDFIEIMTAGTKEMDNSLKVRILLLFVTSRTGPNLSCQSLSDGIHEGP